MDFPNGIFLSYSLLANSNIVSPTRFQKKATELSRKYWSTMTILTHLFLFYQVRNEVMKLHSHQKMCFFTYFGSTRRLMLMHLSYASFVLSHWHDLRRQIDIPIDRFILPQLPMWSLYHWGSLIFTLLALALGNDKQLAAMGSIWFNTQACKKFNDKVQCSYNMVNFH